MQIATPLMIIGEVVKRVAQDKGHNAASLAEATNMSRRTVYDWFNSDNIGSKTLAQLCQILEYDFGKHICNNKDYRAEFLHEPELKYMKIAKARKSPLRISIEIDPDFKNFNDIPEFVKKLNKAVKDFEKGEG